MKFNSSNIGKSKLRRQEFNRSQTKSQFGGKKSLSKRIIEERVGGITKNNIDNEVRLGCMVKTDEILGQIMYHIKFARDTRPSTFNDEMIMGILDGIKGLQVKFAEGKITEKEHIECLEEIDAQIVEFIDNHRQML